MAQGLGLQAGARISKTGTLLRGPRTAIVAGYSPIQQSSHVANTEARVAVIRLLVSALENHLPDGASAWTITVVAAGVVPGGGSGSAILSSPSKLSTCVANSISLGL
jgi:hypothetical protein